MTHDKGEVMSVELDRSLLSEGQRKEYDQWTDLFHGPHWTRLCERYNDRIEQLQNAYGTVQGEQALGRIQGALLAYKDLLVVLPDVINYEFLTITGQVGQDEKGHEDEDDPTTPPQWDR